VRLRVQHTTRYLYPTPASDSHNEVRLMPLSDPDQTCLDFRISTTPPAELFAYDTPNGRVHQFNVRAPHNELTIRAEALVVTHRSNPFANMRLVDDDAEFYRREGVQQRYYEYLAPTKRVPLEPETDRIAAVARKQAGVGTASFLIALNRLLHRVFIYTPGSTNVNTTLQQVLENKQGVCQDFAHLMLSICRRQGIPARYISGYLYTGEDREDKDRENKEEGETPSEHRLQGGHSGGENDHLVSGNAMHAWVECLLPDGQWRGFDPTNNIVTNDYYIKVHYGRDYGDVPPIRGVYRGPFAHTLDVNVLVSKE
jgi:transglutaminase-like putative cysteine protease